jgi:hypothetical protein
MTEARHDSFRSLPFSKPQFWNAKKETSTRPRLRPRWISLSRTFGRSGSFHSFGTHVENQREPLENREGQQQVLCATFPGIRDCVRELLRGRMDVLARKFHETKDLKISDEIYRLAGELMKLDEPWEFVAK